MRGRVCCCVVVISLKLNFVSWESFGRPRREEFDSLSGVSEKSDEFGATAEFRRRTVDVNLFPLDCMLPVSMYFACAYRYTWNREIVFNSQKLVKRRGRVAA